jgi:hypothetical protein
LVRLGIRGFNPKLKKAVERLDGLRTPTETTAFDRRQKAMCRLQAPSWADFITATPAFKLSVHTGNRVEAQFHKSGRVQGVAFL